MKVTVCYEEDGAVVTSFNYEFHFHLFLNAYRTHKHLGKDLTVGYCTDLGIGMVRIIILRKLVPFEEITFKYKDFEMHPDKDARWGNWPKGFCDKMDEILMEILCGSKGVPS